MELTRDSLVFEKQVVILTLPLSREEAAAVVQSRLNEFAAWAQGCEKQYTEIRYQGSERGFRVLASMGEKPESKPIAPVNSYGAARLSVNAGYAEVMDFIAGKQAEGLIVTVMSMGTDRFLFVNGAQVSDRGGNAETWIGTDAKSLVWMRSLMGTLPGRDKGVNYYARLHELLERDRFIDRFEYCVTRPNGDLHRDVSTYHYLDNYLGIPARVAVSRVGDSELVEAAR